MYMEVVKVRVAELSTVKRSCHTGNKSRLSSGPNGPVRRNSPLACELPARLHSFALVFDGI